MRYIFKIRSLSGVSMRYLVLSIPYVEGKINNQETSA